MFLLQDIDEMLLTEQNNDHEFISIKIHGLNTFLDTLSFITKLQTELPEVNPWGCDSKEILIDIPYECDASLPYSAKDLLNALNHLSKCYDIDGNINRIIIDESGDGNYERIVTYKYKKKVSE